MKLSETQRLQLENLHLKKRLLEVEATDIQSRFNQISSEWNEILGKVLKEHDKEIDINKLSVNLATGEIKEIE